MSKPVEMKTERLLLTAEPQKVIKAYLYYLCSDESDKEARFLVMAFGDEQATRIAKDFSERKQARAFARKLKRFVARCIRCERRCQLERAKGYL